MVRFKICSFLSNIYEEIESKTEVGELKEIARTLAKENYILCHKIKVILQSLENQNILIKCLQETLKIIMTENKSQGSKRLCSLLGQISFMAYRLLVRSQSLVTDLKQNPAFEEINEDDLEELQNVTQTVSTRDVRNGEYECKMYLQRLKSTDETDEVVQSFDDEMKTTDKGNAGSKNVIRSPASENDKFTKRRKRSYQENNNSAMSIQKYSPKRSRRERSESRYSRRNGSQSKVEDLCKASPVDVVDSQPKKPAGRRGRKRKSEELKLDSKRVNDRQDSQNANEISNDENDDTNCCTEFDSNIPLRSIVIPLIDVLNDPASENNVYVARYKQANAFNKDNEENEYEVVDDIEASDEDGKVSDNEENDSKTDHDDSKENQAQSVDVSHELSPVRSNHSDSDSIVDDEKCQDTSSADEDESVDGAKATESSASNDKDPQTSPSSPGPPEFFRRGPHTPPGNGPDSEVSGDEDDNEPLSPAY